MHTKWDLIWAWCQMASSRPASTWTHWQQISKKWLKIDICCLRHEGPSPKATGPGIAHPASLPRTKLQRSGSIKSSKEMPKVRPTEHVHTLPMKRTWNVSQQNLLYRPFWCKQFANLLTMWVTGSGCQLAPLLLKMSRHSFGFCLDTSYPSIWRGMASYNKNTRIPYRT